MTVIWVAIRSYYSYKMFVTFCWNAINWSIFSPFNVCFSTLKSYCAWKTFYNYFYSSESSPVFIIDFAGFNFALPFFYCCYAICLYISWIPELSFNLSAYLSVFKLWLLEWLPGDIHAIMITFDLSDFDVKESLRMRVSLDALNGTWTALSSMALIHYFNPSRLYYYWYIPFIYLGTF